MIINVSSRVGVLLSADPGHMEADFCDGSLDK